MSGPAPPPSEADPGDGEDPRLRTGFDHLQAAAREVIAASRAFLDAAEEVVDDPRASTAAGDLVASFLSLARRAAPVPAATDDDDDQDPPVQRIPVS